MAILAFGITYGKTVDPLTAIGAVGFAYVLLAPLVMLAFERRKELELPQILSDRSPLLLTMTVILWGAFVVLQMATGSMNLRSPLLVACGVVTMVFAPPFLIGFTIMGYQERHKTCPECANDVQSVARVCHYCGYRWQSPLPSPYASE